MSDFQPLYSRAIDDEWRIELWEMAFNQRIVITDGFSVEKAYCYHDYDLAMKAALEWDGTGDPYGWFKDPHTGRYQPEFGRATHGIY